MPTLEELFNQVGQPKAAVAPTTEQERMQQELLNRPLKERPTYDNPWDEPMVVSDVGIQDNQYSSLADYRPDRADAIGQAFSEGSLVAGGYGFIEQGLKWNDVTFPPDPNFDINDNRMYHGLVGREYWDELNTSESLAELESKVQYFGKMTKDAEYLDQLGAEGMAYRFSGYLGDVPFLNAIQYAGAAGKLGQAVQKANQGYLGRALFVGVNEGAFEAAKQAMSPQERDEFDILLAAGFGGIVGGLYNPAKYADGIGDTMASSVNNAVKAATGDAEAAAVQQEKLSMIEKLQFNVTSVFKQSPSPTQQEFGQGLFHDVLRPSTEFKATERQTKVIDEVQSAFNDNFYDLFFDFQKEVTNSGVIGSVFGRYRTVTQDQFFNAVGEMHYNPDSAYFKMLSPELASRMRAATDNMGKNAYDILERNGHELFTSGQIQRSDFWMPRRWNKTKLVEDLKAGKFTKEDFGNLIFKSFMDKFKEAGVEPVSEQLIKEASDRFVTNLTRKQVGDTGGAYIGNDQTIKGMLDEIVDYMELDDITSKQLTDLLSRKTPKANKGFAKSTQQRSDLNEQAGIITENGVNLRIGDYLETNVQKLWSDYGRQMGGDTALRSMGITDRGMITAKRTQIARELQDGTGNIPSKNEVYLSNFDAVMKDLLGVGAKKQTDSDLWKMTRMINNLTRSSRLGSTWFAMSAELAQVAHRVGVINTIKAIPELRNLSRSLKGKKGSEQLEEIQAYLGLANELQKLPSGSQYDEMLNGVNQATDGIFSRAIAKGERFSDKAAEAAYIWGGSKSGTAGLEAMFAVANNNRMVRLANKKRLSSKDRWYFKQFGFDEKTTDAILAAMREHGGTPSNKYILNLHKWDPELASTFALGIRRQSHILVQKGNIGDEIGRLSVDGMLAKDTKMGALALGLRKYLVTAWNKQTSRQLQTLKSGDARDRWDVFTNWVYQGVGVGVLGYSAKNAADYAMGNIDEDTYDERMAADKIAMGTFNMTTFASFLPNAVDVPLEAATGYRGPTVGARGAEINPLGANLGYIQDVYGAGRTAVGLVSPERDVSEYEVKKALGTLPLANFPFFKWLVSETSKALAEK